MLTKEKIMSLLRLCGIFEQSKKMNSTCNTFLLSKETKCTLKHALKSCEYRRELPKNKSNTGMICSYTKYQEH